MLTFEDEVLLYHERGKLEGGTHILIVAGHQSDGANYFIKPKAQTTAHWHRTERLCDRNKRTQ